MKTVFSLFSFTFLVIACGCLKPKADEPPPAPGVPPPQTSFDWPKIADTGFNALNNNFWHAGEQYFIQNNAGNQAFNYWWNAHGLDALTDKYMRTAENAVASQMSAILAGIKTKNNGSYINDFYDDMEWLALACLRAFKATNDTRYKETADLLWIDIKGGWNTDMGGGIAWRKSQPSYKNAPANAPAVILAARMYAISGSADDLAWAKKIYNWLAANLVDNATGLVWDGINRQNDGMIDKNWIFTYNQGVFIGAGLELFAATQDQAYLSAALRTANNAITDPQLAPSGILKNENQGDGGLFKGILVRYLAELATRGQLNESDRTKFVRFLETNAKTLWTKGTKRPQGWFYSDWTAMPGNSVDASTQMSGLFLMETMARFRKEGLVQ